jgi:hypothetical protein
MPKFKIGDTIESKDKICAVEIVGIDYNEYRTKFIKDNLGREGNIVHFSISMIDSSCVLIKCGGYTMPKTLEATTCNHTNKKIVTSTIQSYWLCTDCKADLGDA